MHTLHGIENQIIAKYTYLKMITITGLVKLVVLMVFQKETPNGRHCTLHQ